MDPKRFSQIAARYPKLKIAIVGDFCLDRYLEIDPERSEKSIETGRPVHNVVRVRPQPGGAGTVLNNLLALGIGRIFPVGFAGEDGDGFELLRALKADQRVHLDYFITSHHRSTFTYTKPILVSRGKPPTELSRLDIKNWTRTPVEVEKQLARNVRACSRDVDAIILLDQVDLPDTGVVTSSVRKVIREITKRDPSLLIMADSRRGLCQIPQISLKMNSLELAKAMSLRSPISLEKIKSLARKHAYIQQRPVFVTLGKKGILGCTSEGNIGFAPAHPVHGPIDVVGAGDSVTANLVAALAVGGSLTETMAISMAAASIVIHQLGTTGTATVRQISKVL